MTCLVRMRAIPRFTLLPLMLLMLSVSVASGQVADIKADADAEASTPAANDAWTDAATSQNKGDFAKAAGGWASFAKNFAGDPLVPKAKHYLGVCLLQIGEYTKASVVLAALTKSDPEHDQIEESYINLGWSYYMPGAQGDAGRLKAAADVFSSYVRKFPDGKLADQALFYQGESYYQAGEIEKAVEVFQQMVEEHGDSSLRAEGLYALATSRQEIGQRVLAIKNLKTFLKKYEDHALVSDVSFRLAHTLQQDKELELAAKYYARAAADKEFDAADQAAYQNAYCLSGLKRYKEAAAEYVYLVEEHPESPLAHQATLDAGRSYYRAKRTNEAARWLRMVVDSDEITRIEAAHWLNRIYLQQEDLELATRVARAGVDWSATNIAKAKAQAADPEGKVNFPYLSELKLDYAQTISKVAGQYDVAMDAFAQVYTEFPKSPAAPIAIFKAAQFANANGNHEQSIDLANQFLQRYPDHELADKVTKLKATCTLLVDKPGVAENAARELIAANADEQSPELRIKLAQVLYSKKKYQEAIDAVGDVDAIESATERSRIQHLIGDCNLKLKKYDEAIAALSGSIASDREGRHVPQVWHRLGRAFVGSGDLSNAKRAYKRLLSDHPTHPRCQSALFELAEVELAGKENDGAITHYKELLNKFPQTRLKAAALLGKGTAEMDSAEFKTAVATFSSLLNLDIAPEIATRARFLRGVCRQKVGDHAASIEDIDAFLATNPAPDQRSDAQLTWAVCQIELGNWQEAEQTLNQIEVDNPSYPRADQSTYYAGWAAQSRGEHEAALKYFTKVTDEYPDSNLVAESSFHIGDIAYSKRSFDEALGRFQTAYDKSTDDSVREKSGYKLGWTNYHLGNFERARASFAVQVADFPNGEFASDGRFMMAECLVKTDGLREAVEAYELLRDDESIGDDAMELVCLHAGQSYNRLKEYKAALGWLKIFSTKFPDSDRVATAAYEAGLAYRALGEYDLAIKSLGTAARKDKTEVGARARFYLGSVFASKKELGRAMREYQSLMYGYGGEKASPAVKKWQSRAGLEAGKSASLLAESPTRDDREQWLARAQKFYRFVVDRHGESEAAGEAGSQLDRIASMADPGTTLR